MWPRSWPPETVSRPHAAAGEALILDLPVAPTRSLDAYRVGGTR